MVPVGPSVCAWTSENLHKIPTCPYFSTVVSILPQTFKNKLKVFGISEQRQCQTRSWNFPPVSSKHSRQSLQSDPGLALCSAPVSLHSVCCDFTIQHNLTAQHWLFIVYIQKWWDEGPGSWRESCCGWSHHESDIKLYFNTSGWDMKSIIVDGGTMAAIC